MKFFTSRQEASTLLLSMYFASFRAQKVLSQLLRLDTLLAMPSLSLLVTIDDDTISVSCDSFRIMSTASCNLSSIYTLLVISLVPT